MYADNAEEFDDRLDEAMNISGPVLIEINARTMVPIEGIVPAPDKNRGS